MANLGDALERLSRWIRPARPQLSLVAWRILDDSAELAEVRSQIEMTLPLAAQDTTVERRILKRGRGEVGLFPLLDIIVENPSTASATISEIRLRADRKRVERLPEGFLRSCTTVAVTWRYHVLLDPEVASQLVEIPAAQQIRANDADRFVLIVGQPAVGDVTAAEYDVSGELRWSRGGKLHLPPLRVRVEPFECIDASPKIDKPYILPAP